MILTFDTETLRSLYIHSIYSHSVGEVWGRMCRGEGRGGGGGYTMHGQGFNTEVCYDIDFLWPRDLVQGQCPSFTQKHLGDKVWARLGQGVGWGGEKICPGY